MDIACEAQGLGRYVIDIDGCLRATNSRIVGTDDIIALHGRLAADTALVREVNGETVPLGHRDRVELAQDSVAFFRSCTGPRLFRSCTALSGVRPRWEHAAIAA